MGSCADIHDAEPCGEHVIQVADERTIIATARGSLRLDNGTVLHDVVVVPGITRTLISVAALFKDGMHVSFSGHKCEVFGRLLFHGVVRGGIYELQGGTSRSAAASALVAQAPKYSKNDLRHWHQRLTHLNYNSILELENSGKVKGLKIVGPRILNDKCEACALSKVTARSSPKKATRPQLSKDEVCHTDLAGPMQRSIHGNHYFLALKWIGFTHISFLRNKSDAAAAFEDYLAIVNRRSDNQPHLIKVLRSDNGEEFEGTAFQSVCAAAGIEREYSEPHAHYQNGVVERANRTISETARTL
ncbi:Integrase core domain [Phytophthora infestans]|uniref:subtilisin n=1 Tax=Phytophthora infestans TaxID=4787 RepID=A0A8S9UUS2_PHYIN|nr:Integrase core domain [Phytophthora infestans]